MTGRAPAPELPPGPRAALVIVTTKYADESLRQLRAPAHDAADLAAVLADPAIGGFAVTSLIDPTAHEIRLGIEDFLAGRGADDLLLVYLSCHGVRDGRGRLYFTASDSRKTRLGATGVESTWLLDQLDECRSRRQVVVLDCCFSGAFAYGVKGEAEVNLQRHLVGQGRGRTVLTASRGGEYSFEGDALPGAAMPGSVFTTGLIEGLRTGAADTDTDGYISVDDAYDYAFDYVGRRGAAQTPQRWTYGGEGKIWLARSPAGAVVKPVPLTEGLLNALDNPHPEVRLGVVVTLGQWLTSDAGRALTARQKLLELVESEVPRVVAAVRALLAEHGLDVATQLAGEAEVRDVDAAREAKQIIEAAQREYDEIVAEARAATEDARQDRIRAVQDAAIARADAERAWARLHATEPAPARDETTASHHQEAARILDEARRVLSRATTVRVVQVATVVDPRSLPDPAFTITARGYHRDEVDSYLAEVRAFEARPGHDVPPLPPDFGTARRGYRKDQVDYYITLLRQLIPRNHAHQVALRASIATMLVNLARRSRVLVDRALGHIDHLERSEVDPAQLARLFELDHVATRMRRVGENLLVLADADNRLFVRGARGPMAVVEVLRAATAEIEQYSRVRIHVADDGIAIAAHEAPSVIHLVAELLDNATAFSPPESSVTVLASRAREGGVVRVEDSGISMSPQRLADLNELLTHAPGVDIVRSRTMGLAVVARLAARHGITVVLRPAPEGGTVAEVTLPRHVVVPGS